MSYYTDGGIRMAHKELRVSSSGRYLEYNDGRPFFYLGDTAWELFHRSSREDVDRYLTNRATKGFTVIQAVVVAEKGGLRDPNPYGHLPFTEGDPTRPNENYFKHVDYVVDKAGELGLYIGMLPTWGSYWSQGSEAVFTRENAYAYGLFLGKRYRDRPIIWILGGDRAVQNGEEREIIESMVQGLSDGDGRTHLKTFHPKGFESSSKPFPNADWVDFHMSQSAHLRRDYDNSLFIESDYARVPVKPALDGEPRYETIGVAFWEKGANDYDRFDDFDVRQAAYWPLLAGACGHTYGNNAVWQMWTPEYPIEEMIAPKVPWYEAIDHPGALQMKFVRRLFESRPFNKLIPDHSLVANGPSSEKERIRAARASDGSFAFAYSTYGAAFTVDLTAIAAQRVKEIWYNPRYGLSFPIGTSDNGGEKTYSPPTEGRGCDWILILEDEQKAFPLPEDSGL